MGSTEACFLMCPPKHFAVSYAINPWMDPNAWSKNAGTLTATAHREWEHFRNTLVELGAKVELVSPLPGMPDMVFTANSAVVLDRTALLARFRHPQRQAEEPRFAAEFRALQGRGVIDTVISSPAGPVLEGAGDCVWDATRRLFWTGHGQRSDAAALQIVAKVFDVDAIGLELVDPRFYHLDTALCPLPGGDVMYVREAFSREGHETIAAHVAPERRIEVPIADACRLAANCVAVGDTLLMSACGDRLRKQLSERGYRVIEIPLSSFLRSGGAAFCLTLRLDRCSQLATADMVAA